jgi:hypothetical protein
MGLLTSLRPITVLVDGRPEAMLGVMPMSMMVGSGLVWMLATPILYDCRRELIEFGPMVIDALMDDFRRIENVVSVDNGRAIRFLRWLGFIVGGSVEVHGGVQFVPFHLARDSRR